MALIPIDLLATVFETFAPMRREEALRRASLAAETLAATRSRADQLQLGLALRSLEVAPLNAAAVGMRRFSRATEAERERILLGWGTSRLPQRRSAFQALKRLALFLAYADPGPDPAHPTNPAWDRIGYRPPEPPEAPARPAVVPLQVDRSAAGPVRWEADVVVVGSGAGGGVVAARLAAAGMDVLVLEAGGHRPEPEMTALEAEAWRDLMLDRGTTATDDLGFTILAGATLGGGTTVNWTTSLAPPDWLRAAWEREHGLLGMTDSRTDADIDRLAVELELQPPAVVPAKDRVILDGAGALGWEADVTRRNAGPCTDCGGCPFGCARGSKRSGLRVHLAAAQAAGARIVAGARVVRVLHERGMTTGVVGRLAPGGRSFSVRSERVVVAAGALRTPLILSASGIGHPQLGRNLRLHPTVAVIALMEHQVDMWLGPSQAARSLEFLRPGPASEDGTGPAHGGFVIESAPPHPGLAAAALAWTGRADAAELMDQARHWGPLIAIVNETGAGRVRRGARGRAVISYRLGAADAATARRALVELSRLGHAAGAVGLRSGSMPPARWSRGEPIEAYLRAVGRTDPAPNRISLFSAHQLGTARAGADPRRSPTDPWGRVRSDDSGTRLRNAYVGDGSLFPTAAGVNPMLTIMTLAERVARAVLDDRT